jgi:hypothetical protein
VAAKAFRSIDFKSFEFKKILSLLAISETRVGYKSDTPSNQWASRAGSLFGIKATGKTSLRLKIPEKVVLKLRLGAVLSKKKT